MHAELLEIREEGKGKEGTCRAKGKLMVFTPGNGNCFCLGQRSFLGKEGPLFPRAGALRGPVYFISIICVINCYNHLLQGLLFTMLGINKELGLNLLLFWWITEDSRRRVKQFLEVFCRYFTLCRQTHT